MNATYLPLARPTEATMAEYERAVLLAERDFWLARWNALRGVHPIFAQTTQICMK